MQRFVLYVLFILFTRDETTFNSYNGKKTLFSLPITLNRKYILFIRNTKLCVS